MSTTSASKSVHRRTPSRFAVLRPKTVRRILTIAVTLGMVMSMTLAGVVSAHTASAECEAIKITNTPDNHPADIYDKSDNTKILGPVGNGTYPVDPGEYQVRWPAWDEDTHEQDLTVVACPKDEPTISTNASGSVMVGGLISDTATLANGTDPTGFITFTLYGPGDADCNGTPFFADNTAVNGNGDYTSGQLATTVAGTFRWIASYSGDDKNEAVSGDCNDEDESVVVEKDDPTISTQASGTVQLGGQIFDTATLAGGTGPTGTITFDLYGPDNESCAGDPIFTDEAAVDGNDDYESGAYTPTATGWYRWIASYSGDANNLPAAGACNAANEEVLVTGVPTPDIDVLKQVATGDDEFDSSNEAEPGDVVNFRIRIENDGDGDANEVPVTDDINDILAHATYNGDCSDSCGFAGGVLTWNVDVGAEAVVILTFSVTLDESFPDGTTHLPNVVVVQGPGSNCPPGQGDEDCETDTEVSAFLLSIEKTNNAPLEDLELSGGEVASLPTADEGETVTYTLTYDVGTEGVNDAVITDVLPAGVEYVLGSASSNAEFTFAVDGYDAATRTLTWTAEDVDEDGFVTYQAIVQDGANELEQPLTNIATIDSDDTEPDSDTSDVFVPVIPLGETSPPKAPTAPPTDTLESTQTGSPGTSLPLLLGVFGVLVLGAILVTPVPATVRRRNRR